MPLMSKISTFSFNKESFWVMSGYMATKNLLLGINFLSFVAGLVLIGGGGYMKANSGSTGDDMLNLGGTVATAAIAIGIIVTLVSFLGCFGAANEKGLMLKTYFAFLLILVILELSVGIAAYVKKEEIDELLDSSWSSADNATISKMQTLFTCCGYKSVTQYAYPRVNCTVVNPTYTQPCYTKIYDSLTNSLSTIALGGLIIGVIELLGLILSVGMFRRLAIRKHEQDQLLAESWRVNKEKIQHGYQNYQVGPAGAG